MEHLLDGGHGPVIKIPFHGQTYDGENFLKYPQTQGWEVEWLTQWTWAEKGKTLHDTHAFLQAWLFFGLLENVMSTPIPSADLIYHDVDGSGYITTACLEVYAKKWKLCDYTMKDSYKKDVLRRTTPYIQQANTVVLDLWQRFGARQPVPSSNRSVLSSKLHLSLQLVGVALTRARSVIY